VATPSRRLDAEVEFDVRDALHSDFRLASADIEATVRGGVAHLTGSVPNYGQKALAGTVAERIKGVRAVDNRLVVIPRSPRSDVEITADVSLALAEDAAVDEDKIEVMTVDGVVYLRGSVESYAARRAAESDARAVEGVLDVINELVVAPSFGRSDLEVGAEVGRQLERNLRIQPGQIAVEVVGGVAHLRGEVDTLSLRWLADELARWTPGVIDVVNELKVRELPEQKSA